MLVQLSCDCVGFINMPHVPADQCLVVVRCDNQGDDPSFCMSSRPLEGKTWTPLDAGGAAKVMDEIGRLINDGYRFRMIKQALRV